MDIQVASNFERALFEASGRDSDWMSQAMRDFAATRRLAIPPSVLRVLKERYLAARADDAETIATIARVYKENGIVIDPHTAVGVAAAEKLGAELEGPVVALATAHPAKFSGAVMEAIGKPVELPAHLSDLSTREERYTVLANAKGGGRGIHHGAHQRRHDRPNHTAPFRSDRRDRSHASPHERGLGRVGELRRAPRTRRRGGPLAYARAHGVQGHDDEVGQGHRHRDRSRRRRHQRLYQPRADRVSRPRAEGRCRSRARYDRRYPAQFHLRGRRADARARGHHPGNRSDARHARRSHFRSSPGGLLSGPADGLADLRQRENRRRVFAPRPHFLHDKALSRGRHDADCLGRGRSRRAGGGGTDIVRAPCRGRRTHHGAGALSRRRHPRR